MKLRFIKSKMLVLTLSAVFVLTLFVSCAGNKPADESGNESASSRYGSAESENQQSGEQSSEQSSEQSPRTDQDGV